MRSLFDVGGGTGSPASRKASSLGPACFKTIERANWHVHLEHLNYVSRIDTLYTMIKTFRHKGVAKFFASGSKAGIQPKHANKLSEQLLRLNSAVSAEDMNLPGWAWHPLSKDLEGHWAVSVSGNWRLTFSFEGKDAILVDYQDYH